MGGVVMCFNESGDSTQFNVCVRVCVNWVLVLCRLYGTQIWTSARSRRCSILCMEAGGL